MNFLGEKRSLCPTFGLFCTLTWSLLSVFQQLFLCAFADFDRQISEAGEKCKRKKANKEGDRNFAKRKKRSCWTGWNKTATNTANGIAVLKCYWNFCGGNRLKRTFLFSIFCSICVILSFPFLTLPSCFHFTSRYVDKLCFVKMICGSFWPYIWTQQKRA